MPALGYSDIVENMLDHPKIKLRLCTDFAPYETADWYHVFWTGRLDGFFDFAYGQLGYRTTDFVADRRTGDFQGCAVMNHPDEDVDFVRSTEFKYLTPWETHTDTIIYREYPRECGAFDEPMYPIRAPNDMRRFAAYSAEAQTRQDVTFVGRLGTYRYLDMDDTIREALDLSSNILSGQPTPTFSVPMLQ